MRDPRVMGLGAAAVVLVVACTGSGGGVSPTPQPAPVQLSATEVARGFLDALGAHDEERVASYIADRAIWGSPDGSTWDVEGGWLGELHWEMAWEKAVGVRRLLDSCIERDTSADGTRVRCTWDLHAFGSDELGRGPFPDNTYDFTIQDGKVVAADEEWDYVANGFSREMWEPFRTWIRATHPDDGTIMYDDWPTGTSARSTDESMALWQKRISEWVATQRARAASAAPSP